MATLVSFQDFVGRVQARRGGDVGHRVLVIGLGNPILGDDGVGWAVARQLADQFADEVGVDVDCLAVGGLGLMERMLGYSHVILVDSIETGMHPVGTVSVLKLADLKEPGPGHTASAHDASLMTALATARLMDADVPEQVDIVAIEARVGFDFTETLTPAVAAAVMPACERVAELLQAMTP
jgi:hydrogenase maturation protease